MNVATKVLLCLSASMAFLILFVIVSRIAGLLVPYRVPTSAMSPAIQPGDLVIMESFSLLWRAPERGDVVVFRTDGIKPIETSKTFVMRVVGEPEEHVRLEGGEVFIDNEPTTLRNGQGVIQYFSPDVGSLYPMKSEMQIPSDRYFVLGDHSLNSFDSRFWGTVPAGNIRGRAWLCVWPLSRVGKIL